MALERGQAVGIPAHVECGAQWIVAGGNFAEVGDAAAAAFARRRTFWRLLDFQRAIERPRVGEQAGGKLDAAGDVDEKVGEQQREQDAGNFHDASRASPADALRVVKNWSTFFHWAIEAGGAAEARTSRTG